VRSGEDGFVGVGRPQAVAALHLAGVRAGLARQHAGIGAHADHLVAQPTVLELVEQPLRLADECPRIYRRLRVDGGRQLRRAVVSVHDPLDVAADLQAQAEVPLFRGLGHRGEPTAFPLPRLRVRATLVDGRLRCELVAGSSRR
jgi:hypothetical protein